jgi:hypothetical protein
MKRPYLVNFNAIVNGAQLAIRASISTQAYRFERPATKNYDPLKPVKPIQGLGLIRSQSFRMKVLAITGDGSVSYNKEFDSDAFGNFEIYIPISRFTTPFKTLHIFETSFDNGLLLNLGTFIPYYITEPKKIIISDFDRTLVDTRFSTAPEIYRSLSQPLSYFPDINKSISLLKDYLKDEFQPFILSASPHFYEDAIRNWLYQHNIYANNLFLKDYRKILSLTDGLFNHKDIKKQGFYKLDHLVNILLMTGVPSHLVLMGDGFESDTFIYVTLAALLLRKSEPRNIWDFVKKEHSFQLTTKQNTYFLSKLYQLASHIDQDHVKPKIEIYIRCTEEDYERVSSYSFPSKVYNEMKNLVDYYVA